MAFSFVILLFSSSLAMIVKNLGDDLRKAGTARKGLPFRHNSFNSFYRGLLKLQKTFCNSYHKTNIYRCSTLQTLQEAEKNQSSPLKKRRIWIVCEAVIVYFISSAERRILTRKQVATRASARKTTPTRLTFGGRWTKKLFLISKVESNSTKHSLDRRTNETPILQILFSE